MPDYKLQYFELHGRAEPIRILLHYLEIPYTEEYIKQEDWPSIKPSTPLGQLPVLTVDEKLKLGQTTAILRYLGRTHGLCGLSPEEDAVIDMYGEQLQDGISAAVPYIRSIVKGEGDPETTKKEYVVPNIKNVTGPIFENQLKANGTGYLVGKKLTWVDLFMANFFSRIPDEELLDDFPTVKKHKEMIFNLPTVKKYIETRPKHIF
ncbi:hypothetical protein AB6A40_008195 [Gnathostoma spinigerum]|uniref:Glutathione S-transferase 1 n=1 Tax=Gnathostoma spinigerum TaxID=75299 RepID=A0ABD6ENU6_9BILA